jgi:hypothetical protein
MISVGVPPPISEESDEDDFKEEVVEIIQQKHTKLMALIKE